MPRPTRGSHRHVRAAATAASLVALLAIPASSAAAQQVRGIGGDYGIAVWSDAGYRGTNATFHTDVPDLRQSGFDNRISSIRVAYGETWEVCEFPSYRGRCQSVDGEEHDLKPRNWNDLISSMRRVRGGGGGGARPPMRGVGSVTLFPDRDFEGAQRVFRQASPVLATSARRAYSARVVGSWLLCAGSSYQQCRAVSGDIPDLAQIGLAGRIVSLRPAGEVGSGGGSGGNPGDAVESRLVTYSSSGYRGSSRAVTGSASNLEGQRSAYVSGRWMLCDGPEFRGTCRTVAANVPDVRSFGLDAIRSARPMR